MWGVRVVVQVSKRELHRHIHLDLARLEFLSCIKNEKKKSKNKYNFDLNKIQSINTYVNKLK